MWALPFPSCLTSIFPTLRTLSSKLFLSRVAGYHLQTTTELLLTWLTIPHFRDMSASRLTKCSSVSMFWLIVDDTENKNYYWTKHKLQASQFMRFLSQLFPFPHLVVMSRSNKSSWYRYMMLQNPNEILKAICCNLRQKFFVTNFLSSGNNLTFSKMRTKSARLKILKVTGRNKTLLMFFAIRDYNIFADQNNCT